MLKWPPRAGLFLCSHPPWTPPKANDQSNVREEAWRYDASQKDSSVVRVEAKAAPSARKKSLQRVSMLVLLSREAARVSSRERVIRTRRAHRTPKKTYVLVAPPRHRARGTSRV
jgi:hypothetical protein